MISSITPNHLALLGAARTADISEGLQLMVVGMGIVFGALILIMIMMLVMNKVVGKSASEPVKPPAARPSPASRAAASRTLATTNGGIPTEVLAVITAAVAVAVGKPFRIHSVRTTARQAPWAVQGRAAIHRSHRVRRGSR